MANGSIASLAVDISADIGRLRTDFQQANREATKQMADLRRNVDGHLTGIEDRARRAGQAVLASLGAIGTIEITKRLSEVADGYSNIQAKLKLVTNGQAELTKASNDTFNMAQKTYTSYDAMATIVGRTERALESLGSTSTQALKDAEGVATVVSEGLAISGATASEASSSVIQLTQALSSNKLAGDEFRSFMENAPRLATGVAKALGVTIGELRNLSKEGKLNTEIVTKALLSQAAVIEQEFANVPLTVGRAWQVLSNDFTVYVGQAGAASGVTMGLANALIYLGDHLNVVGKVVMAGAIVILARQISSVVGATAAWVDAQVMSSAMSQASAINTLKDAEAQAAVAASSLAAADAKLAEAKASSAQVTATASVIATAQEEQIIKLRSLEVEAASAAAVLASARARGAQSAAIAVAVDAEAALTRVEAARIAVVNELAALGLNNARSMAAQTAAAEALAVAEAEVAAAQTAAAAAAARAAAAQTGAAGAAGAAATGIRGLGAGLLAFVGGPVGLTIAGVAALAYGLYALSDSADSAEKKADELIAQFNKAAAAARNFSTNPIEMINSSSAEVDIELMKQYNAELAKLEKLKATPSQGFGEVMRASDLEVQKEVVARLKGKIDELRVSTAMAAEAERERSSAVTSGNALAKEAQALLAKQTGTSTGNEAALRKEAKAWEADQKELEHYNEEYSKWYDKTVKGFESVQASLDPMAKLTAEFQEQKAQLEEAAFLWQDQPKKLAEVERAMAMLNDRYEENKTEANGLFEPAKKASKALTAELLKQEDQLSGLTREQVELNAAMREANEQSQKAIRLGANEVKTKKDLEEWNAKLKEISDNAKIIDLEDQFGQKSEYEQIADNIKLVEDALEKAIGEGATDKVEKLTRTLGGLKQSMTEGIIGAAQEGLRSLQSMTKEGSKSFRALQIAIDATTVVEGILAVVHQLSSGDVYSAIPRAAAVAAAIAKLGVSIGGIGGGGGRSAEYRQEHQGTGTVLGDATAQSESIAHAVEITAHASEQLVGLNRGMLNALQSMQAALGAAGNQIARGAANADFGPAPGVGLAPGAIISMAYGLDGGSGDWAGLFHSDPELIDQGIKLLGGSLGDMLDGIVAVAYQQFETGHGLFGDLFEGHDFDELTASISDKVNHQFQLIFKSMADTVEQAAVALGLPLDEVKQKIAEFQVAEQTISLKDLSAEDQQKALEAVFSSIFDGLAASVVPFIEQFQMVGEGLGETLVRVATEVQVAHEAFRQLGISVSETDPERFAQIADGLIQAVGGIDAFINSFQSFMDNFASSDYQFKVLGDSLNSALGQVGLTLPTTRDGFFDLMQTLDATTEEGRAQIAMLLKLTDTADEYYDALERQNKEIMDARQLLGSMHIEGGITEFQQTIHGIRVQADQAVDALNLLARSEGRAGASASELAAVNRWAAEQARKAIMALRSSTMDLVSQLYGGAPGSLDEINRRIQEAESSQISGIDNVDNAAQDMYQRQVDAIKDIKGFLDDLMLGDLTTLTPQEQLTEAQRQYLDLLHRAQAGDADAMAALPDAARAYLEQARSFYGATDGYTQIFDSVTQALQAVVDTGPTGNPGDTTGGGTSMPPELQALYAQRDAMLAQQDAANRLLLAQQLAEQLGDLSQALGIPVFELASQMGVSMDMLVSDLGVNLTNFTETTGAELAGVAAMLGVTVPELAAELGISMADLVTSMGVNLDNLSANTAASIGAVAETLGLTVPELTDALGLSMVDLVTALGVNLDDLTVQTVTAMATMAGDMGLSLTDLAHSVGVDLGNLADSQSLLNDALEATISGLPAGTRDMLRPLLEAVENATTEADANAAIAALKAATEGLPEDQRELLAPYFEDIDPTDALTDLEWLHTISDIAGWQLDALGSIGEYLAQIDRNTRRGSGNSSTSIMGGIMGDAAAFAAGMAMASVNMSNASDSIVAAQTSVYGNAESVENSGASVAKAIDNMRECMEESDEETRRVLTDRLEALEDAVYGGADKQATAVATAVGKTRNKWGR